MSEWQPIETAPHDGTEVMLFDRGITIGFWREAIGGFYDCIGGDCGDPERFYPTYWFPLPDAPQSERTGA